MIVVDAGKIGADADIGGAGAVDGTAEVECVDAAVVIVLLGAVGVVGDVVAEEAAEAVVVGPVKTHQSPDP